jgi:hypothetical protein
MKLVVWMNGRAGRLLRIVVGLLLVAAGVAVGGGGGVALGVVGLVVFAVGALGVCLLAPLLRVSPRAH